MPIYFITNAQLLDRYDYRWIGQQMLDTAAAATQADLLNSGSTAGGRLQAFIGEASEMLMAAAAVGDRYNAADIQTYGGQLLIRIVSDLTMGLILKRRARPVESDEALTRAYDEALGYLEQLRQGERIFYMVPNVPEAGLPAQQTLAALPGFGPPLITDQCRIFGDIGYGLNYGYGQARNTQ